MTEMEILQGTIAAIVFQNYDNGYAVLRLQCEDGQTVTIVGTIPLPTVGERLMVTGKWSNHSNYGRQFEAEFLERLMPQTAVEIQQYLAGRIIKGIGPRTAAKIVAHFGDNTLRIMESEPERLSEISGISPAKAQSIGEEFRRQVGLRHLMEFFSLHNLPAELAVRTYKMYGEQTIDLLYDDPYLLMDEELDAPFAAVDRFAIEMGVAGDDPRRVEAGVLFELRYNLTAGHSFLPREKLVGATVQLLSVTMETVDRCVTQLLENDRLSADRLAGIDVVYLPALYTAELYCKQRLLNAAQQSYPAPNRLEKLLSAASAHSGLQYSPQQEDALRSAATSGLLLITGGPGTGKSATRFTVKQTKR